MSSDLVPYFENPTVVEHPGGHFIPATSKQKEPYMNFIREHQKRGSKGVKRGPPWGGRVGDPLLMMIGDAMTPFRC